MVPQTPDDDSQAYADEFPEICIDPPYTARANDWEYDNDCLRRSGCGEAPRARRTDHLHHD